MIKCKCCIPPPSPRQLGKWFLVRISSLTVQLERVILRFRESNKICMNFPPLAGVKGWNSSIKINTPLK